MSNFGTAEMARRLDGMISIGRIVEVRADTAEAKAEIGDLRTAWLPWMAHQAGQDRTWWVPEIGSQVVIVAPSGNIDQGVILSGALYSDANPAPADTATVHRTIYADGAVIEYDRAAHRLTAVLPAGGEIDLTAPGGVTINGDLVVTGDVNAGGAGGVSLLHHKHDGVQSGGSLTNEPVN